MHHKRPDFNFPKVHQNPHTRIRPVPTPERDRDHVQHEHLLFCHILVIALNEEKVYLVNVEHVGLLAAVLNVPFDDVPLSQIHHGRVHGRKNNVRLPINSDEKLRRTVRVGVVQKNFRKVNAHELLWLS